MRKKSIITAVVIEDDKKIAHKIKWHILSAFKRKIQVLTAHTYKDAVEIIEQGLVEIFIVDFGLPDGDGEELIRMIRAKTDFLPIIAQTTIEDMTYQLKIFKDYEPVKYLTKKELFQELTGCLIWAKKKIGNSSSHRIIIPGRKLIDSLNIYEVCYIEKITKSQNLHIELYDFETQSYKFTVIKNLSLEKFMTEYNKLGIFLRCHQSYIVNKKMVEKVHILDNEILLLFRGNKDRQIRIPIGSVYKKPVLTQLKGLC